MHAVVGWRSSAIISPDLVLQKPYQRDTRERTREPIEIHGLSLILN